MTKWNYPNQKKVEKPKKVISPGNRGKGFESLVESTNEIYKLNGWGFIEKTEAPVKVQRMNRGKITLGYYAQKGFVDFFGVSHGRAIAFDAKETNNRTSFPLKNVHDHQLKALKRWKDQGGHAFLLINFQKHQECYLLTYDQIKEWFEKAQKGGRKSIPYDWFLYHCDQVKQQRGVFYDYLALLG